VHISLEPFATTINTDAFSVITGLDKKRSVAFTESTDGVTLYAVEAVETVETS